MAIVEHRPEIEIIEHSLNLAVIAATLIDVVQRLDTA